MMRTIIQCIAIFLVLSGVLYSDTINIPADYPTIQEGIDAAVNGDTVLVAPGTYYENIDFKGKAITVMSEQGPESTIIDGGNPIHPDFGSVVTFQSGEGPDVVLEGFTLTNGTGSKLHTYINLYGGGIYCFSNSSPTILGNIIRNNQVTGSGGGILCYDGCSARILGNLILSNYAENSGGGIYCSSKILQPSSTEICSNLIAKNECGPANGGGAICCYENANPLIVNNTITRNTADAGGGIWCRSDEYYSPHPEIIDSILWDNNAVSGPEIWLGMGNNPSFLSIKYSNVMGGKESAYVDIPCILNWGPGMIDADPIFVDPASDDFHLTYNSPCRDTGDNTAVTELYDFEGNPRIAWGGTVDMGADEFYTHLYITGDQTPGGDIQGKLVGLPGTSPVRLFIGLGGVRPTPLPTVYGDLWLLPPRISIPLVPIPSNGILAIPTTIPLTPPAPYDVPMQGLVGLDSDSLTNLCVLEVR